MRSEPLVKRLGLVLSDLKFKQHLYVEVHEADRMDNILTKWHSRPSLNDLAWNTMGKWRPQRSLEDRKLNENYAA